MESFRNTEMVEEREMSIVTYYMPKRLKKEVILLAAKLNIKITIIEEDETDIRIYCVGIQRLLDAFNRERITMIKENGYTEI